MISYRIFANDGAGGVIDWSTPIDAASALTWTSAPLSGPSQWRFGVRAYDTVSGLEDASVDAVVDVELDASSSDVSGIPPAVHSIAVRASAGGGYRVDWAWTRPVRPTGFKVFVGTPTPDYGSPVATVPFVRGLSTYSYNGTGLSDGTAYQVAVRSYNAVGESTPIVADVIGLATPPAAVDGLSASTV